MMSIITPNELGELSRPISKQADKNRVSAFIREAEDIDVLPSLGNSLLNTLRNNPDEHMDLLEGCEYNVNGETLYHVGLKRAVAYYAYARMLQAGDGQVTRYGFVDKNDSYSSEVDSEQRANTYRGAFDIADAYMAQVLDYLQNTENPLYKKDGRVRNSRVKYRIIGN